MEKIRTITILFLLILVLIAVGVNGNIIENKREIVNLELIEVIGIDVIDEAENKIELSFVRNIKDEQTLEGEGENAKATNIISIKGTSYNDALRKLQTILSKHVTNWHVKYFIIGKDTAENDVANCIDFLLRDTNTKFNSKLYISKDKSAKELVNSITNVDYKLSTKIANMEKNIGKLSGSGFIEISNVFEMISEENPKGLIPTIENYELDVGVKHTDIDFGGYAILKNNKIIYFLDLKLSRAVNFVNNKIKSTNIDITDSEGKIISLGITNSKSKINFIFNKNELEKIVIKLDVYSNIEEAYYQRNIISEEKISELESKQSNSIKENINDMINISKENDVDFLNMDKILSQKHPYKWNNIKQNWQEIYKEISVEISVNSIIKRTYDSITHDNF